jgi:hypothetical protein
VRSGLTLKTCFCIVDHETARLCRINKVKGRLEQSFYFVNRTRVFGDIDVPEFGAFLAGFDLREVFVAGCGETDIFLCQLSLHLHTSGTLLLVASPGKAMVRTATVSISLSKSGFGGFSGSDDWASMLSRGMKIHGQGEVGEEKPRARVGQPPPRKNQCRSSKLFSHKSNEKRGIAHIRISWMTFCSFDHRKGMKQTFIDDKGERKHVKQLSIEHGIERAGTWEQTNGFELYYLRLREYADLSKFLPILFTLRRPPQYLHHHHHQSQVNHPPHPCLWLCLSPCRWWLHTVYGSCSSAGWKNAFSDTP